MKAGLGMLLAPECSAFLYDQCPRLQRQNYTVKIGALASPDKQPGYQVPILRTAPVEIRSAFCG